MLQQTAQAQEIVDTSRQSLPNGYQPSTVLLILFEQPVYPPTMANMGFPAGGFANQGWKLYLTSLIMILSAGLFVIIRIATRIRTGKLGADDYTIVFSLVSQENLQRDRHFEIALPISSLT